MSEPLAKEKFLEQTPSFSELIHQLLVDPNLSVAAIAAVEQCQQDPDVARAVNILVEMRHILAAFAAGDFSPLITSKGVMGGCLKNLQANLRHMTWQAQRVAEGDFSQHIDFMGDFSKAFNTMTASLETTLNALRRNEAHLTKLTEELQQEIDRRAKTEEALRQSEQRYRLLSVTDALTGVYNRRRFFDLAILEMERIRRTNTTACISMLDVDKFKNFNDTYGHLNGDKTLKHVAKMASSTLRKIDVIARYGGEEFVFLFPETNLEQGAIACQRILTDLNNNPVMLEVGPVTVTASLGVSMISRQDLTEEVEHALNKCIDQADQAMYEAKSRGRNQVVVAQ